MDRRPFTMKKRYDTPNELTGDYCVYNTSFACCHQMILRNFPRIADGFFYFFLFF